MDTKISYARVTRRIFAFAFDHILLTAIKYFIGFNIGCTLGSLTPNAVKIISDNATILNVTALILALAFYAFTIIEFGGTPGQLLLRMHIKDKNTLEKITITQTIIRTGTFGVLYFIIFYKILSISSLFIILPIIIILFATFDKHKQFLNDKIAKTVVIDYKPS